MNKISFVVFSLLALIVILTSSCKHDPITPLSDARTISFATDVQPIIIANCTQSGCHGTSGSRKLKLVTYDEIASIVSSGKPHSSSLYTSITSNVLNTMPKPPNPRLSDIQIKTIYVWIMQGAKNN
ncbi:MAG: hypothetical protein WCG87_08370 [Bacteroidota bacterium]